MTVLSASSAVAVWVLFHLQNPTVGWLSFTNSPPSFLLSLHFGSFSSVCRLCGYSSWRSLSASLTSLISICDFHCFVYFVKSMFPLILNACLSLILVNLVFSCFSFFIWWHFHYLYSGKMILCKARSCCLVAQTCFFGSSSFVTSAHAPTFLQARLCMISKSPYLPWIFLSRN